MKNDVSADVSAFVERYQILYEKDPSSKIFAPLAEAYRRMGLVDEAIDLAMRGVKQHPHFASGRVALGKCYVQKNEYLKAIEQLKAASDLSPENLLAHQLLAECYVKTRKPIEALGAFKMVLFLNPHDTRAAKVVKKLEEDLFAEDASQEVEEYSMEKMSDVAAKTTPVPSTLITKEGKQQGGRENEDREIEQELGLLDAHFDRGDWVVVRKQIEALLKKQPGHPEVIRRKAYLDEITQNSFNMAEFLSPIKTSSQTKKVKKLEGLLERIDLRRKT